MAAGLIFRRFGRIGRGTRWRRMLGAAFRRADNRERNAHARIALRWYAPRWRRPHGLPGRLVVSLTSYPPRFATLAFTLRCLLRQTVKADHTVLWIAHSDWSLLPRTVLDLQDHGLEIRATRDLGPYKKIIPALDAFPDAFVCTADDDLYYRRRWLEELVNGVSAEGRVVSCHRAHEIAFEASGNFSPYGRWPHDTSRRGRSGRLFPTGGAGALYPPGTLAHSADDRQAAMDLCPHGDDLWLFWMGRRNGANYNLVGRRRDLIVWSGSQETALWHSNLLQGGNDEQIRKLAEKYGYPVSP